MASQKVIIPIVIIIVLIIVSTAGCVNHIGFSQESSDTSHSPLVIVDADPGIDDSIAFFLENKIIGNPDFYIATAGNVTVDLLKRNFFAILEYINYDGEYALGAESRLDGKEAYYDGFFGADGLGNESKEFIKLAIDKYNYDTSEVISPEKEEEIMKLYFNHESISDIASSIKDSDSITYIALGPLTSLAILITEYPEIKNKINHVYIMGGGFEVTNAPNKSEFNMAADPLAAKIVLSSGLDITLFPLDATTKCILSKDDIQKLKESGKYPEIIKLLEYGLAKSLETNEAGGFQMNDPITVLYQKYPEIYTIKDAKVTIDENGHLEKSDDGYPIHVVTDIDTSKIMEIMEKAFAS